MTPSRLEVLLHIACIGIARREGIGIRGGSTYVSAGYILWSDKLATAAMVNAGGAAQACTDVFNAVRDA